jgi:hypothetical protein
MPYGTIKVDNITFDNGGTDKLLTVSGLFFSTSGALTVTGTISGGNVTAPTATFTTLTGTTTAGTTATFTSGSFTSLTGVTTTVTSGVFSSGIATAPSVAIGSGTTYKPGIYSPGADQVAISTNGSGRLFIDSSGRVNIGTTSEPRQLHVSNGYSAATSLDGSLVQLISSNGNTGDFAGLGILGGATGGSFIHFGDTDNAGVGRIGYFHSDNSFRINTNGTEVARIDSSGNVGIGTSAPGVKLEVRGSLSVGENYIDTLNTDHSITLRNTGAANNNNYTARMQAAAGGGPEPSDSSLAFLTQTWNGSAYVLTEKMRIDSSGRLLVGTPSVTAVTDGNINPRLEVEGTDSSTGAIAVIRNSADANGAGFVIAKSRGTAAGSNTSVTSSDTIGEIRFEGADGTQKRIAASIGAVVDGTPGANDMPGRLVFSVTADGAASPTEALRIKNSRIINIANTPVYADNAAAKTGGLVDGDVYRKSDGTLMIVYT